MYRLHFQKWRLGIAFSQSSDCAINVPLSTVVANRARLACAANGQETQTRPSDIMYPRSFNYSRPPYPVTPQESHSSPPPLSHPPYVYSPPSRYSYNAYPCTPSYPPSNSPSYSHIPQPLTHYGDPRFMEMSPRDEVPVLHHLPQQSGALDHPEHPRQVMESAAQLLPSCEQGNETI